MVSGGQRHVADRADKAQHGDDRPDDHVLERAEAEFREQRVAELMAAVGRLMRRG
jgi:hypothetical protein